MECHCHHSLSELIELHWFLWDTEISSYNIISFKVSLKFGKRNFWATLAQHTDWFADFEHVCWCPRLPQKTPGYFCNFTAENIFWDFLRLKNFLLCQVHLHTYSWFWPVVSGPPTILLLILKCSLGMVILCRTPPQTLNHLNTHYPKKKHINYQWVVREAFISMDIHMFY